MQSENNIPQPFRFHDPRQVRIHRRLLLVSPGAASFYLDACRLMVTEPPLEATTHLVAHLLRETESSLRNVLKSIMERPEQLDKRTKPPKLSHEDQIRAILKGLEIPEEEPVAEIWLQLPSTKGGYGLEARAHRDDLARPRPLDEEYRRFWDQMESILDVVLERFESRYLESHRTLDELLAVKNPTRADARRLRLNVPNNLVAFGYFFHNLTDPAWLEPLREEGLFRHPLEPERNIEKGTIGFPLWPQSRYLARMAIGGSRNVQQTVLKIALQIETENFSIHEDLMNAALAMPAEMIVELVRKETAWVEQQTQIFGLLPEKLGEVVAHLAKGGQVDAALDLAQRVLAVLPNPRAAEREEDNIWGHPPDPVARFEDWDYEQILKNHVPEFVSAAGERALVLLCELLETAITLCRQRGDQEAGEDYSYIWRPDLDDNDDRGVKDTLISAVRKAAEQLAGEDPRRVPKLVNILESHRWLVFKRLAFHLLRFSPDSASDLICERLTEQTNYEEQGLWHEYILLARDQFNNLSDEQRDRILGWIDVGPSIEEIKAQREWIDGKEITDEQAIKSQKYRKLRRLAPLRDVLPPDWRKRYDEWARELEEPEHAEYVTPPVQVRWGLESPMNTEDLRSKSIEQIVAFLSTWQPSENFLGPVPEGLGRQLAPLVTSEPERFATEAEKFRGLDPTYVRAFLSGLCDAVKQPSPFSWSPVLALCCWVVKQPREIPERANQSNDLEQDKNWGQTRAVIADLLSKGFKESTAEIPFELRQETWDVLQPLTDDPEPTPEYEERYGGTNMDPFTLSLNTVRAEAMHAVVRYALWVSRHIKEAVDGEERMSRGFDEIPEVRKVLDDHLDRERDPSLAIRAVYGHWLPWLGDIDHGWASLNWTTIYPANEGQQHLWNAAWEAYIRFVEPYDNVLELLHDVYARAIESLGEESQNDARHPEKPSERLAHHLMIFYGRGKLDLEKPDGLLAKFYERAPDALRAQAFWLVGRDFQQMNIMPPEVLERIQRLCERRIQIARSSNSPGDYRTEMKAVGWLFASLKFDDTWALAQLRNAIEVSGWADPDYQVVEHLAALAPEHPALTVECLGMMIDGAKDRWGIRYWSQHARTILAAALRSADDSARQTAVALINRLGARGFLEFKDLL